MSYSEYMKEQRFKQTEVFHAMSRVGSDPILTPGQVARLYQVCTKTVTRWAHSGRIASFKTPGGQVRFLWSKVREDIERNGGPYDPPPVTLKEATNQNFDHN